MLNRHGDPARLNRRPVLEPRSWSRRYLKLAGKMDIAIDPGGLCRLHQRGHTDVRLVINNGN